MIDSWTNIRGIRVAQQLSFSNKSVADGGFLEKNLQEGFMGAGEKKKKAGGDSKADGREMKKRLPLIMLSSPQCLWMLWEGENYSSWAKSPGPVLPHNHQPDH